jgi:hypothetical protein
MSRRTVQNAQGRLRRATSQMSTKFGEPVRRIDAAWPGYHTRHVYHDLSKRQAGILAQLRTGMTPLNGYLHNIKATEMDSCDCGQAPETREHFIFHGVRWSEQRKLLGVWTSEEDFRGCSEASPLRTPITELRVVVDEARHFKLQGNGTGDGVPPAVPARDVG